MKIKIFILLLVFGFTVSQAQYGGKNFSFSVNAVYTTTAKLYLSPNSSDPTVRNRYFGLSDILNPAIDFRYRLTDEIILGIGTEYMEKTQTGRNEIVFTSGRQTLSVEVEDGFLLIPVELSAYYLLPFSTEQFKFLMGGGGALYYGEHIRKFGDAEVSNVTRKTAYGIHVLLTMDYLLRDNISFRFEMKFRDPQFSLTSRYNSTFVNYQGETVTVSRQTFASKVNVDGVTFILGAAFHF